jgi:moderate conductance mechanosensitive channel
MFCPDAAEDFASFCCLTAFALGSIGPFLALDWPPLLRQMLFGLLVAVLIVRVTNALGHFLLAPNHERFRIIPMVG